MDSRIDNNGTNTNLDASDLEILSKLERAIIAASLEAKSIIAKEVFDPINREKFATLLCGIPPIDLVIQLNEQKITPSNFQQFKVITSQRETYPTLFELPPQKWLDLLTQEKFHSEDLLALIGTGDVLEGAVSGVLTEINELEDPVAKARALYYLNTSPVDPNNSSSATDKNINPFIEFFLKTLTLPKENSESFNAESFKASFKQLYHLINNIRIHQGDSLLPAIESIIRIKHSSDTHIEADNQARVKAAMRLVRECVANKYNLAFLQLDKNQQTQLQTEEDAMLAKQMDESAARELDQKWNSSPGPSLSPQTLFGSSRVAVRINLDEKTFSLLNSVSLANELKYSDEETFQVLQILSLLPQPTHTHASEDETIDFHGEIYRLRR